MTSLGTEPHVLLEDWGRRKPFAKYVTLHEEQQSWPTENPRFQELGGTAGPPDRNHDVYTRALLARTPIRYHIQDMEPTGVDVSGLLGDGKVREEPAMSVMKLVQQGADWDYVRAFRKPESLQPVRTVR